MTKSVYLALYKGKKTGKGINVWAARLCDWAIRTITRGQYSHCEIAIDLGGKFECYSASLRDGGVRRKLIDLAPDKWDLIELPENAAQQARELYRQTLGTKYDVWGLLGVVLKCHSGSLKKWFCSEWCAQALGLEKPAQYSPNSLAHCYQVIASYKKK
ncbi:hypothetical protein ACKLNO_03755 [Neisseriaceae bacterium B1]